MSHYLCIINKLTILILWISIFPGVAQEKFPGELTFSSIGLESGEAVAVTISASWNKTRWFSTQPGNQPPYLPTSNYSYLSGQGQGDNFWALHAPDDSDSPAIAWGYYTINVQVTSRGFDCTFDLDLRDANWVHGGYTQKNCQDTEIIYSTTPPNLYHQRAGGGYSGSIGPGNLCEIWDWYLIDQNKIDLLVPVTATNNFTGGQIKMDGITYSTPTSFNWGWTTSHTISAISPQNVGGVTWNFYRWSDGLMSLTHSLQIDDSHNSYSFTALFSTLAVTLTGPDYLLPNQIGTFSATITGGVPSYTIKWYKMQLCSGTQELAGGEPDAPPCNVWIQQSRFDGKTTATACGSIPGFKMKVEVTDAAGFKVSAEKQIIVEDETRKALPKPAADVELPADFTFFPAFPNPFNPQTTLRYALPEASQVILAIYNLHGAAIKTIIEAPQPAGVHSVSWNGTDQQGKIVPAGIYLCQLQAIGTTQKFSQTQKLSLIK